MLGDDQNLQTVKDELVHAVIAFDKFRLLVRVKGDRSHGGMSHLTKHLSDFNTLRDRVNGWIARAEHRLLVSAFDVDSEVKPEGSVSRVDSQVWSSSSRNSSR